MVIGEEKRAKKEDEQVENELDEVERSEWSRNTWIRSSNHKVDRSI